MIEKIGQNDYTVPLREDSYKESHSPEFNNPIQNNICVWLDMAKISKNEKSLYSNDFSKEDTAFIIQRVDGPEAYVAHVKRSGFNSEQLEEMNKLPQGEYVGRFIRGSMSCGQKTVTEEILLKHFPENKKIEILPPIILPTERYSWDMIYRPKPNEDGLHILMIESRQSWHTLKVFDFLKR